MIKEWFWYWCSIGALKIAWILAIALKPLRIYPPFFMALISFSNRTRVRYMYARHFRLARKSERQL